MIHIKNGKIKTMAGAEYENGCILPGSDGKILAVGERVEAPKPISPLWTARSYIHKGG